MQQDIQLSIGQHIRVPVEAGSKFSTGVDISVPNSLISVSMQVEEYDIKIGLFKASQLSDFQQIEDTKSEDPKMAPVKAKTRDAIHHIMEGPNPYECIIDFKMIEKSKNGEDITINYLAVEPGFYRIVFSNQHSWVRQKTVIYRYCVLVPVDNGKPVTKEEEELDAPSKDLMELLDDDPEIQGFE